MSLVCYECKRDIEHGELLMAVGRGDVHREHQERVAVCRDCLAKIPSQQCHTLGYTGPHAIVVSGRSGRSFTGSYSWTGFSVDGPELYRVPQMFVGRHLPLTHALLFARKPEPAHDREVLRFLCLVTDGIATLIGDKGGYYERRTDEMTKMANEELAKAKFTRHAYVRVLRLEGEFHPPGRYYDAGTGKWSDGNHV